MSSYGYKHWVNKAPLRKDFPFTYKLQNYPNSETVNKKDLLLEEHTIEIEVLTTDKASKVQDEIKDVLVKQFNYSKYLNKYSESFKKFPVYNIVINRYSTHKDGKKVSREEEETWYLQAHDFQSDYEFNLVDTPEKLTELLTKYEGAPVGFDTETTGLNPEIDYIVGISLAYEDKKGYYIPVAHDAEFNNFNLGQQAIYDVYDSLTKAEIVFMFNARFDMRMLEYTKGDRFLDTAFIKYNDAQLNAHFADSGIKHLGLKQLETHFLGYARPDLAETLKATGLKTFNFKYINPKLGLFYAAQDAISTLELGKKTYQYYKEFKTSGEIDQKLVYVMMQFENNAVRVDTEFAKVQLEAITNRLEELNQQLYNAVGDVNFNSSAQKATLLQSYGLDTGEITKSGAMATGIPAILEMLDRLKKEGKEYPAWLDLLEERASLDKLSNTFFGRIVEQAEDVSRMRVNYRLGNTATGRLSSGKDTGDF